MHEKLLEFERWFQAEWAPINILDVEKFSTWQIRRPWMLTGYLRAAMGASYGFQHGFTADDLNLIAFDYAKNSEKNDGDHKKEDENKLPKGYPYPHRSYPLVQPWEVGNVPVRYSLKKIGKLLTDIFARY